MRRMPRRSSRKEDGTLDKEMSKSTGEAEKRIGSVEEWVRLGAEKNGKDAELPLWFCVNGRSMYPLIRVRQDRVMLVHTDPAELRQGDIVLFPWKGKGGNYCLHRICRIDGDRVQTLGDGNRRPDRWIPKTEILGKAVMIQRGKRQIYCGDPKWMRRWRIWNALLPIRGFLLLPERTIGKLKRMKNGTGAHRENKEDGITLR